MPAPQPNIARPPRPHPAQRARKIAGAVTVVAMVALTGCMAATTKTATGTTATATPIKPAIGVTPSPTATSATTTTTASGDDYSSIDRWAGAAAVPGPASSRSDTSTNAS
jgi:hypothetical protein